MSVHVMPLNDETEHIPAAHCLCDPRVEYIDPRNGLPYPSGPMVVHNSSDCREVSERVTGEIVSPEQKWEAVVVE